MLGIIRLTTKNKKVIKEEEEFTNAKTALSQEIQHFCLTDPQKPG